MNEQVTNEKKQKAMQFHEERKEEEEKEGEEEKLKQPKLMQSDQFAIRDENDDGWDDNYASDQEREQEKKSEWSEPSEI